MIGQDATQLSDVEILTRVFDLGLVSDYSLAIDGGANVGTWSEHMAHRFEKVIAFEPGAEAFGILCENMAQFDNVDCRNVALMDKVSRVDSVRPRRKRSLLTSRIVVEKADGEVPCVSIDSLGLESCGLIKLDLEGAEGLALRGAKRTISRCKPVLVVEIWGLSEKYFEFPAMRIHKDILRRGYKEVFRDGVDRVYVP